MGIDQMASETAFKPNASGAVSFEDAVVIVTGAARGLGQAYARLLAARGAKVIVNDIGIDLEGGNASPELAAQIAADITAAGGTAIGNASDIATEAGANAVVAAAMDTFGRLDAVINNAGAVRNGWLGTTTLDDLDHMLSIHTRGAFLVTNAAWKTMVKQRYGRIVMTTSCGGLYGQPGLAAYGAAKGALMGLTRVLSLEGESQGIRVNAIAPLAYTRLAAHIPEEDRRALFERHLRVEQVAPLVALLAHRECPVTGEIFDAGAGRYARMFIGEGIGYLNADATIEDVRDNFDEVMADRDHTLPRSAGETVARTVELLARIRV